MNQWVNQLSNELNSKCPKKKKIDSSISDISTIINCH